MILLDLFLFLTWIKPRDWGILCLGRHVLMLNKNHCPFMHSCKVWTRVRMLSDANDMMKLKQGGVKYVSCQIPSKVYEKNMFKDFAIWVIAATLNGGSRSLKTVLFLYCLDAPHTIWSKLVKRFQRIRHLKLLTVDDGRRRRIMTDGLPYYKVGENVRLRWAKQSTCAYLSHNRLINQVSKGSDEICREVATNCFSWLQKAA